MREVSEGVMLIGLVSEFAVVTMVRDDSVAEILAPWVFGGSIVANGVWEGVLVCW